MMSYASGPLNMQMRALNWAFVKAGERRLAVRLKLVLPILIMMNVDLDVTKNVMSMCVNLLWDQDVTVMMEWYLIFYVCLFRRFSRLYSMANANQEKDVSLVPMRTRKYGMQEINGQETIALHAPAQVLSVSK